MAQVSSGFGFRERQLPLDSAVNRAARTELGRENTDPAAVANLINFVVQIHDCATNFNCASASHLDPLGYSRIDLDVIREISGIGEVFSESAAIDAIDAEHEALPVVNGADRVGEGLIVIQKNIVAIDKFQFVRSEVELTRFNLGSLRDAVGEIFVGVKIFMSVRTGELDPI